MRNNNISDEDAYNHDYWPNELSELRRNNPTLYKEVVESNLEDGDTVDRWEQRNLERAKEDLAQQRRNKY